MSLDQALIVSVVFFALIITILGVMVRDLWHEDIRYGYRFAVEHFKIGPVLTWCRSWTFRGFVLQLGFACIAVGQRLMDWAQRPETPIAGKLCVRIHQRWEREDIEVTRERNVVRARFGHRTITFKV